ncbi:MAG: glycoside hydrolase family 92 protein, partial [Prolixibacteraceae bacterium]|nr:glycoside hydrolase family 92 protein [Prolixibacteraceae bacterium]
GFHKYTFPQEKKKGRYIVIDLSHSYVGMLDARLKVKNEKEITGMIKSLHNGNGGYHQLYFAVVSDTPFKSYTTWEGASIKENQPNCSGNKSGIWINLPEESGNTVKLKVGLSTVNEEQAMVEANSEIKGWDFEDIRNKAALAWDEKLSKIEVKGGSEEFKMLFYTHLYHSYLVPNISSSSNGMYRAAYQPDSIYLTKNTSPDFDYYSTWTTWDDFRKYTLISLLEPQIAKNIARSLVDHYKHRTIIENDANGYWPNPSIRIEFASAVIMDAFIKGLGDIDTEAAFKGMKEDFENYGDENVSAKLEKAYHAYIALEMAKKLGKTDEIKKLTEAADSYKKMWCPQQKDNQGNVRGFFTPDGQTVPDVEEFEKYVYEGNLWHYRWFVLHDITGLAELRGGKDLLADDLEYFFNNNFYMHLNEPDIHYPYLFNVLGKPFLTQKWVREYTTKEVVQLYHNHGFFEEPVKNRIYRTDTKGYIETMDDDGGAMSSWFVMSAMGLFQLDLAKSVYLIGSPIFPEMVLHLDNGNEFRIIEKNVSEDNFYIESAKLNGKEFNQSWIDYKMILDGGVIEFEMSDKSNSEWGRQ